MFYDLNVPSDTKVTPELTRTIFFLAELGYTTIALSHTLTGKLPTPLTNPLPTASSFPSLPPNLTLLTRATVILTDPSTNHRLPQLAQIYDLIALRPTNEKLLLQACSSLEADLISLDFSQRLPFHLKHKVVGLALSRGLCFEVCYSAGIQDANARRNLIGNVAGLTRATRTGKGIIISSEARKAVGLRAPHDVVNLGVLWGLRPEVARDAVGALAGGVARQAQMRRRSFKGVVEVVDDGGVEEEIREKKRKAEVEAERLKGEQKKQKSGNNTPVAPQGQKLTKAQRREKARAEGANKVSAATAV